MVVRSLLLLIFLLPTAGCLHTPLGEIKLPKSLGGVSHPTPENTTKVEDELSGKPAAQLNLTMAEQLEKAGKEADAIGYYEKARAADPANLKPSRRLAVLYDRAGDSTRAMTEFRALLAIKPKDADLLNDVGYSCYNRGEWVEAETYLRKAVDADKNHKRAWVNLGMALAQQGRQPESLAAFEKAVTPAEAKSNLAFVLAQQGNSTGASEVYREALAADANLKPAQLGLAALEPKPAEPPVIVPPPPTPVNENN